MLRRMTLPLVGLVGLATVWTATDTASTVAITGNVTFRGSVPAGELIDMTADAYCAGAQATQQSRDQPVSVGEANGLRDVVVYVKEGPVDAGGTSGAEPVVLDQKNCMYRPRLVALRTSQPLLVRNSDATLHNVHVHATENRSFNIGQPFQGVESRRNFPAPEMGIVVRCDVHGWMSGSIAVFDHGFFGVTDDNGNFSVEDLPPGDYVFEAWHPELGVRTRSVTVAPGEAPQVNFEFGS